MKQLNHRFLISLLFIFMCGLSQAQHMFYHLLPGFGTPFTWVGLGGDANWNTAANWSEGVVPGASDIATFDNTCVSNCDPIINIAISVSGINIKNTYAGTITQDTGNTITIGASGWSQASGNFNGGNSAVTINGVFTLSGGTYTATSGTWTQSGNFTVSGAPTFNHNNGLWTTTSAITMVGNGISLNNVTFGGAGTALDLGGSQFVTLGELVLNDTVNLSANMNNGTIEVRSNVTVLNHGKRGNALLRFNGTGAQSVTGSAGNSFIPAVEINKASGTLTLISKLRTRGNWSWLSGTVDASTSQIIFDGDDSSLTVIPGNVDYNDVNFSGHNTAHSLSTGTLKVLGTLVLEDSYFAGGAVNSGNIEAYGNVNLAQNGKKGSAVLKLISTGAQALNGTATGWIPNVEINKPSGTLTVTSTLQTYANWTWLSGTVDASTSSLVFSGNTTAATVIPGPVDYNNVTFTGYATTTDLSGGTMKVNGTLIFSDTYNAAGKDINNGTINASGNVAFSNFGKSGTAILNFIGATNSTLTIAASAATLSTTHNVAKTGLANTVSLVANTSYAGAGRNFTITSGTLNIAGFAFSVNSLLTIGANGRLLCNGGTATAGSWSLLGQVSCGTSVGITWTGLAGDNLWSTAGNWTNNNIPGASDIALFNASVCIGAQCNAQINSNLSVRGINLLPSYTGTLTQNATRTLTLAAGGYSQAAGTFAGADGAINLNGPYSLSAGTFTATSGTWTQSGNLTISGSAVFNHNGGSWVSSTAITISANASVFNNVSLGGWGITYSLNSSTMIVEGTLTIFDDWSGGGGNLNSGTIEARGNINVSSYGKSGSALIRINGTGNQTWTGISSALHPNIQIDKPSGTLTISGTISTRTNWTYTAGTVDASASTINFTGDGVTTTIIPGTMTYNNVILGGYGTSVSLSSGTMTVAGNLTVDDAYSGGGGNVNSGTIDVSGNIIASNYGKRGSALVRIVGTGNQTWTGVASAMNLAVQINKPSGTLTLSGTISTRHNWTHSTGTVDAGTSTVNFTGDGVSPTIVPGTMIYNHVIFSGYAVSASLSAGTMTVAGNLTLDDTYGSGPGNINSGTIDVSGNINALNYGKLGSANVRIVGTGNQTWTGISTANNLAVQINKPSGTLTLSGTIQHRYNWTYTAGTIDSGTSTIYFSGSSTSATITPGTIQYNNVGFVGYQASHNLNTGTITVAGTLTLADSYGSGPGNIDNGTIDARGDISVGTYGKLGSATLIAGGPVSKTLTSSGGAILTNTTISVAKTGGTSLVLGSNLSLNSAGRDFTISSGTFDLGGYDFTINDDLTIAVGAILKCNGGEFTATDLFNSGTVNCPGYSTYDFNWTGAGGDSNWSTPGNWQGGVAPGSGDVAAFQDSTCGGTCNSTISAAANVRGVRLFSPFTGVITQAAGQTLTIGVRGWTQNAGTFTGGDSNITNNGNFVINAGTFTSTSGIFTQSGLTWNPSSGTFAHNNGTVTIDCSTTTAAFNSASPTIYNNLNFTTWAGSYTLTGTTQINGTFQFGSASGSGTNFSGGTINAHGNVSTLGNGTGSATSTTVLNIVGSGAQTITGSNGHWPSLVINKPSGTVTLSGTLLVAGTFTYTAGNLDAGTSTLRFSSGAGAGKLLSPNGVTLNNVIFNFNGTTHAFSLNSQIMNIGGTMTVNSGNGSSTINSGTINLAGNLSQTGTFGSAGTANLNFVGSTSSTITQAAAVALPGATVTINKTDPVATVTLTTAARFNNAGQNLTIAANNTLNLAGFDLTVGNNISNGGSIIRGTNPTCGTISQGGSYSGNAAICP